MIDPASVAITLALLGAGWLLGRHARLRTTLKSVQPICLCKHAYGFHAPQTGACQKRDGWGGRCDCRRYTGPQPVEQYRVPPAADMSIITAPRAVEGDPR